jgi:pectate lyase
MRDLCSVALLSVLSGASLFAQDAGLAAFPGAEGFGALATGGRGGEVYHVTNLDDSGPGSFRAAVNHGPRVVVFDVGGYIELHSPVSVGSDLTIAGQTAPGDGIATRNYEVSFSGSHNVIVRNIRFRQGLTSGQDRKSAVNIHAGTNMVFDHVSIEWGRWDTVDMTGSSDITIQYSIIGEGISPQMFGCLCESDNVSLSHNLWINNHSRNPKAKGSPVQYVSNVVYDWGVTGLVGGHSAADHFLDVIDNYFIAGPSSTGSFAGEFTTTDHVYHDGNYVDLDRDGALNGRAVGDDDFSSATVVPTPLANPPVPVTVDNALDAYVIVMATVGASLNRDSVDLRLIGDLMSLGTQGQIISDPAQVGGFGTLLGGDPPASCAGDGIPDDWKIRYGLDPCTYAADDDFDGTGYTNIEKYINSLIDGLYP